MCGLSGLIRRSGASGGFRLFGPRFAPLLVASSYDFLVSCQPRERACTESGQISNFVARELILRVVGEGQLKRTNSRQHKQEEKKRYDKTESFFPLGRVVVSSSAGIASQQSLSGELELTCRGSLKLDHGTI